MAEVRLSRIEAEQGHLPGVCMRCAAPAVERRHKNFSWRPSWVIVLLFAGLLPYLIVALILEKRSRVVAPFCAKHANHWTTRTILLWCLFGTASVIAVASFVALGQGKPGERNALGGALCLSAFIAGLVWLIAAAVCHETSVHATEITDHTVTVKGVSDAFAAAVNDLRARAPAPYFPGDAGRPFDPYGRGAGDHFGPGGPR